MSWQDNDGDGYPDGFQVDEEDTQQSSGGGGPLLSWGNIGGIPQTLKDFLKSPKKFILGILAVWFVNSILDFVETVMGLVLSAWGLVAGIPGTIASSLIAAGSVAGQPVLNVIGTTSDLGLNLIGATGWLAPIVLALLFVALLEATEEVGWAALPALSDLLGAIPVVGSILDAVLTFLINLAGGRS